MKKFSLLLMLALMASMPLMAQKNLLVVEKPGNKKNFKYFEGDKIEFETTDSVTVKGMITAIKDSTITLDFYSEFNVKQIRNVYRVRWGVSILSKMLMIGGAGMILVEALNGAISGSEINNNYLFIGAGAAAAGALLIPLQKAKFQIAPDKWKAKILPVDKEFNYQKNKTINF